MGIHKVCPHLRGGKGLTTMRTKVEGGREEVISGRPFQYDLCEREESI